MLKFKSLIYTYCVTTKNTIICINSIVLLTMLIVEVVLVFTIQV